MKDTVRNKLQSKPELNPFSSKYLVEEVRKLIKENSETPSDGLQIANAVDYFNQFYNKYIDYLKENFQLLNSNAFSAIQYLVAMANREVYLVSMKICNADFPITSIKNIESFQVESMLGTPINAIALQEGVVDNLNTVINIIRYGKLNGEKMSMDLHLCSALQKIYVSSNLLYMLKKSYDIALWEKGYIDFSNKSIIHIKYQDENIPILKLISDMRSNNNILGTSEILKKFGYIPELLYDIDCVKIDENGYLQCFLCKNENHKTSAIQEFKNIYSLIFTELMNYYPFITQENFETCDGIGIKDFVTIFAIISEMVNNIHSTMTSKKNTDDTNIDNFVLKIKKRVLMSYIKDRTGYTKNQILSFLKMLESSLEQEKRIDLWKNPLLLCDDSYHFITSNILAPKYIYIVDEWLEMQDYDMKIRGTAFEQYVKHEMGDLLRKKGCNYKIPGKSKFRINNIEEEIDLIVVLKDIVIIAELKCIKYPMDSRDINHTLKILEKATKQSIRKTEFLQNNWSKIIKEVGNLSGKEFISLVITNFPIFTGLILNGVAVMDYFLFDSYFRSGALSHVLLMPDDSMAEKQDVYYTCEDEMNRNFKEFTRNPPSVQELRNRIGIYQREITLPGASIQIYLDYPE